MCVAVVAGNNDRQGVYVDNVYAYAVDRNKYCMHAKSSADNKTHDSAHGTYLAIGY